MDNFWSGFEKRAARIKKLQGGIRLLMPSRKKTLKAREAYRKANQKSDLSSILDRIGETINEATGGTSKAVQDATHQRDLRRLITRQGVMDPILSAAAKAEGVSKGKMRDEFSKVLAQKFKGLTIGGTIAKGKKGNRAYISVPALQRISKGKGGKMNLREVVHHENFHQKVPVLGSSEILAHMYGGARATKGKIDPKSAVESLGVLAKARPGRMLAEAGIAGGTAYGGKKLYDKATGKDKKK